MGFGSAGHRPHGDFMPVTEFEAASALPADGWVRRYVVHAIKQTTSPLIYHIGTGLTILAATCPLAYGMNYAGMLRANNFCLLVGRSGEDNKSSALNVGREILDAAAASLIGEYPGSPEGLIESLAVTPSQMIPISEFGRFLAAAQGGYYEPMKTLLADAWDCLVPNTDILTTTGWVKIQDVKAGDTIWALNPENDELVESKVYEARGRPIRDGEKLVQLKNDQFDILATEGHRFYVKDDESYTVKHGRDLVADQPKALPVPGDDNGVKQVAVLNAHFGFVEPEPGQMVYCATTEYGTLITRRSGKVVILGNCGAIQRVRANNRITRVDNPRLSIAAACSIPYLEKHTLAEDWTGGFMGRWMVLYGQRERIDPDPIGDRTDFDWLAEQLRIRATMPSAGWCMGLTSAAKQLWTDWFHDVSDRVLPGNIIGIRARAPTICRKVALLYGWDFGPAMQGNPWEMDVDVLEPAIKLVELHIKSLIDLSGIIAEHHDARQRRSVIQAIESFGGVANLGEILSVMKTRKRTVTEILDSLIEEKRVAITNTSIGSAYTLN